jgi:hypothetical protein
MWLEGAVQSGWSVSRMREERWQALGAPAELKPREEDIIEAELDEDAGPLPETPLSDALSGSLSEVRDEEPGAPEAAEPPAEPAAPAEVEPVRPFEDLPPLPPDLDEAVEAMKLAILNHKLAGWKEISCESVLAALTALKQLALAPA